MKYLGCVVSVSGVSSKGVPSPNRGEGAEVIPRVDLLLEVYPKIAGPLYHLMRKDVPYDWTEACQEAFNKLKLLYEGSDTDLSQFLLPILTDAST